MSKSAEDFLGTSLKLLEERGKNYDQEGGERSMGKTVTAFNAITGRELTEAEGWLIMSLLKFVRVHQNPNKYHEDSNMDAIAYAALHAEAQSAGGGLTRSDTEALAANR